MPNVADLPMPNTYLRVTARTSGDVVRLLAGTGLSADALAEEGSITVAQQLTCIRNSMAMMRRRDWHLAWARRVSERFHGPISLAQLSAPTLGDGIDVFARYMHCRVPYMRWRSRLGAQEQVLSITPRMPLGDLAPILFEIPLLSLVSWVQTVRPGDVSALIVELTHAPMVRPADYRHWYACTFRFGATRNAVVIPREWRDIVNVGYDAMLWEAALRQCRAAAGLAASSRPGIVGAVRAVLYGVFATSDADDGPPTLCEMARRLNLSTRTLSRRLTEAGTSYQERIDEVRKSLAREMIGDGMRVADIAQGLGYANTSSFDRACMRWFGSTPSRLRAARR